MLAFTTEIFLRGASIRARVLNTCWLFLSPPPEIAEQMSDWRTSITRHAEPRADPRDSRAERANKQPAMPQRRARAAHR